MILFFFGLTHLKKMLLCVVLQDSSACPRGHEQGGVWVGILFFFLCRCFVWNEDYRHKKNSPFGLYVIRMFSFRIRWKFCCIFLLLECCQNRPILLLLVHSLMLLLCFFQIVFRTVRLFRRWTSFHVCKVLSVRLNQVCSLLFLLCGVSGYRCNVPRALHLLARGHCKPFACQWFKGGDFRCKRKYYPSIDKQRRGCDTPLRVKLVPSAGLWFVGSVLFVGSVPFVRRMK